jgi:hypothetical protein
MESEGPAEKYRAVIEGDNPPDEPVGQRWAIRVCALKTKAISFTHRNKVIADGTVRKDNA